MDGGLTARLRPAVDLVAGLGLRPGSVAVDVGAREAGHCIELSRRFGFTVHGVEPVVRHLDNAACALQALAAAEPEVAARIGCTRVSRNGCPDRTAAST